MVFLDECGFSFTEKLATTWAPIGCPPVIRRVKRQRRVLSSVVALTLRGKIYKRHFRGSIGAAQVVRALHHVRRWVGTGFILIWDRLSAHRAQPVKDYLQEHPENPRRMAAAVCTRNQSRRILSWHRQTASAQQHLGYRRGHANDMSIDSSHAYAIGQI